MRKKRLLGRYRLVDQMAAGGNARVWRAVDEQLDRPVAVKLLHPHLLPDETSRLRLAAEARAAAGLSHPGIATVYDVSTDAQAPALVMELVDGESLAARLRREGTLDPRTAAQLVIQVAEALYHAHQRGVIHRDVKPGNVLLEAASGRARLIDFGIAHSLEPGADQLTVTGTSLGTPRYMAPEQLAGERVGPRTDLWALGAVLYECLTGGPPYDGVTPLAIARRQLAGAPDLAGIEPALAALVRACLETDPAERPLHAGSLAAALRAWLAGDPAPALAGARSDGRAAADAPTPPTATAAVSGAMLAAAADRPTGPGHERWRRRRWPAVAAVMASLALASVAVLAAVGTWGDQGIAAAPSTQPATPMPTPDWLAPLLESYAAACDGQLPASQLADLDPVAAEDLVGSLAEQCAARQAEADEDDDNDGDDGRKGKGRGRGGGGDD